MQLASGAEPSHDLGPFLFQAGPRSLLSIVLEFVRIDIAHQRQQTGLVVYQQYSSIVLVQTNVGFFTYKALLAG